MISVSLIDRCIGVKFHRNPIDHIIVIIVIIIYRCQCRWILVLLHRFVVIGCIVPIIIVVLIIIVIMVIGKYRDRIISLCFVMMSTLMYNEQQNEYFTLISDIK